MATISSEDMDTLETWVEETHSYLHDDIQELVDWADGDFDKIEHYMELMDEINERWAEGLDISDLLEELEDLDLPDDEWTFYHG